MKNRMIVLLAVTCAGLSFFIGRLILTTLMPSLAHDVSFFAMTFACFVISSIIVFTGYRELKKDERLLGKITV